MFFKKYSLFAAFLSLFSLSLIAQNPDLTLENLNALTLNATASITGKKVKYIPQWFEAMKKKGIPSQGVAFVPTSKKSSFWEFKKGIPSNQKEPIFIHSCPRDDFKDRLINGRTGHSFRCTHAWLKNSVVNGTFITFDYFFDGKNLDLGQGINVDALKKIYDEIAKANPHAPLVIAGTCIGAKIALEFAVTHNSTNLKAMILETPFIDMKKVICNIGKNYLGWFPFASNSGKADIVQSVFEWYAPNCKASLEKPHAKLENFSPKIPVFIAHLKNDAMCSDEEMHEIITDLAKSGNNDIYLLVIQDSKTMHGRLNQKKEFAQATNAFLAAYNLPHDAALAQEGAALLADAKLNTQASSAADWRVVISEKVG